jgi:hypothetical protein
VAAESPSSETQSITVDTSTQEQLDAWPEITPQNLSQLLSQLEQTASQQPDAPKIAWDGQTLTITLGIGGAFAVASVARSLTKIVEASMPYLVQRLKNRGEEVATIKADGREITVGGANAVEKAKDVFDALGKPRIITP